MVSESLSFRVSRSTEGLAETLATLSQRLVKLEQLPALPGMRLPNDLKPLKAFPRCAI
jgi:hypothetical protein